ncbi:dethiobiotin synthetase [Luteibacter sp. UNCMF331Sha3.1]|uniref:dethiobiotin synthase n=1 Tax=Luteibacter sp. UNCMF331Sha3.1 TaxID=1502760 RepID=UPI0008BB5048|nr:dethiobiotin synthase [Luteibacter sp. UNCMF331Sha3.1]SEM43560.1 dethiobiotin synthetase [Luteibacter sp. UNCMF331Sha3.1]
MSRHLFVAGTDTGIGKTHGAQALIHALRRNGGRVAGMKPVASGSEATADGLRNEDALALQAASAPRPPYDRVNPIALAEAVAPHLAAARAGVAIDWPPLDAAFDRLRQDYDRVVVEGVGGWLVPLGGNLSAEQIPARWGLDVVLVVGMRLGCISHARLTARAIEADGCRFAGWIANVVDPSMPLLDENIATLRACLSAPCLGVLPHGVTPADAAGVLDVGALD